jgi:hypothetical protein
MASRRKTNVPVSSVEDVVFNGVMSVLRNRGVRKGRSWTCTMTDLSFALVSQLSRTELSVLPGSPSALRVVLNRVVNRLRNRSVSVKFGRTTDHSRTRFVRFAR